MVLRLDNFHFTLSNFILNRYFMTGELVNDDRFSFNKGPISKDSACDGIMTLY